MAESPAGWASLRAFMQAACGVVLADDQSYLMEHRLAPVARALGFKSVDAYVLEACRGGAPRAYAGPLIDAMTTHETSFFRDPTFWRAFQEVVLPKITAVTTGQRALRVWCGACSSGQEPYTLSMLLEEFFPQVAERASIVGTDVSEAVLAKAAEGVFTAFEVNRGVSAPRLLKHFERQGGNFRLKARHRRRVTWQPQNLVSGPPPGYDFDVVMLRNVLIYFPDGQKQAVLARVRGAARAGGFLAIGTSELLAEAALSPGWYVAR